MEGVSLTADELRAVRRFTWRGPRGDERPLTLSGARAAHDRLLVAFEGVADRDLAAALTLGDLYADASRLPDPGPQVAYTFQLVGLRVETEQGRALGTLAEIVNTGAQPMYVVRGGERELLVPAVPDILKQVDLAAGRIVVSLPPGLEEL
jgi:16S rRNA processing protein RimM